MSKAAHTPGPWHVADAEEDTRAIDVKDGRGLYIAEAFRTDYAPGAEVEGQANARLIAAAPCLLEAAKTVLAGLEKRIRHERESTPVFEGIAALHEAICKATGQD